MPTIASVLETTLYVSDLARAAQFYQDVLGLRLVSSFENDRGMALRAGPSILLLFRADVTQTSGELPAHGATGAGHVAFLVADADLPAWRNHLQKRGVAIETEISFNSQPPSIYFRDPDGNSLELAVAGIWPA